MLIFADFLIIRFKLKVGKSCFKQSKYKANRLNCPITAEDEMMRVQ